MGWEDRAVLKQGDVFMIHRLKAEGLSIRAIARRTGLDRKTVRRYLREGLTAPVYAPRAPRGSKLDAYRRYVRERIETYPELSAQRLFREIGELGYEGCYTSVKDYVREVRPPAHTGFERRFETPPGRQGQVDFAQFKVCFGCEPGHVRVVWLFSLVLGFSRYLFARFVFRQTLDVLVRCHLEAFAELGGVPHELLYDRMKTAVLGEDDAGEVIYHPTLLALGAHYGFRPRACRPYRAKTKGKVERPFRYVRQDFFLGRTFYDMADLNAQLDAWRAEVANVRKHGTTKRVISEALTEEQPALSALPAGRFSDVLKLERRITRDGMVSVDGNLYSVPDTTRARTVEIQLRAEELRIFEAGRLIAVHALLTGRGQRRMATDHRRAPSPDTCATATERPCTHLEAPGLSVAERPLSVYDAVGQILAEEV